MSGEQPPDNEKSNSSRDSSPKRSLSAMSNSKLDIDTNEIGFENADVELRKEQL